MALAIVCASSLVLAETPATQPATQPAQAELDEMFKTPLDAVSYVIGYKAIGEGTKHSGMELNTDMLLQGYKDALAGTGKLTEEQMRNVMMYFFDEIQNNMRNKAAKQAAENKKIGEAFLAKNAKEEGIMTLPSGLQYKVIKEGDGPTPKATDTVEVRYRGTLIDGKEFDTSGNATRSFPVSDVVEGMSEALQKMPMHSKWKLFIPDELAYGPRAASPVIGPNAVLIIDVELVGIQEKPEGTATQPGAARVAPITGPTTRPMILLRPTPSTRPGATRPALTTRQAIQLRQTPATRPTGK
jgi:FKBP-type peptidyl-prolyl cis-trans isomerase FklB